MRDQPHTLPMVQRPHPEPVITQRLLFLSCAPPLRPNRHRLGLGTLAPMDRLLGACCLDKRRQAISAGLARLCPVSVERRVVRITEQSFPTPPPHKSLSLWPRCSPGQRPYRGCGSPRPDMPWQRDGHQLGKRGLAFTESSYSPPSSVNQEP